MTIIGSAYVEIRAITDKLQSDVAKSLQGGEFERAAAEAGQRAGEAVRESFERETDGRFNVDPPRVSDDFSVSLKKEARRAVEGAESEIERLDVDGPAARAGSSGGRTFGDSFAAGVGNGPSGAISRIALALAALAPIIAVAVAALSSLVSGLFAVASAVAPAVASLAVLPGILGSVIQGALGIGLAFKGIGGAVSAGLKPAVGGAGRAAKIAKTSVSNANAIANAQARIKDVQLQNARATQDAAKAVSDASDQVARTEEDNADRIVEARSKIKDAQDSLDKAIHRSVEVQQELSDARKQAAEDLQQLAFSARGAAIDQGQALIALQRAKENLARFTELPVDNRLRKEAQLAADEAQLRYEEATDKASDLQKENTAAQKSGVEGSKSVVSAKKDEADAQQDVVDAVKKVAEAEDDLGKVRRENARDLEDANDRLKSELQNQARVVIDNSRRMADAQRALAQASERAAGAGGGAGGGGGGISAFNQALAGLSPAAQKFVRYLVSVAPAFRAVKNAAGDTLFPLLQVGIQTVIDSGVLKDLAAQLRVTGTVVGQSAVSFANLSKDPFFRGNLNTVLSSNNRVLGELGHAIVPLVAALISLAAAAAPVTEQFAHFIRIKAEAIAAYTGVGKSSSDAAKAQDNLRAKIQDGASVFGQVARIVGNLSAAIFALGRNARPAGQILLNSFETATKKLRDFAEAPKNAGKIRQFFLDVAHNVQDISSLAGSLGSAFLRLGDNPGIGKTAKALKKIVPTLETFIDNLVSKNGEQFADTIDSIAKALEALSKSGALNVVLKIVQKFAQGVAALANNSVTGPVILFLLAFGAGLKTIKALGSFTGIGKLFGFLKKIQGLNGAKIKSNAAAANAGAGSGKGGFKSGPNGLEDLGDDLGKSEKGAGKAGKGLKGLLGPLGLISGPVLAVVAAIGALVGVFIGAYKESPKLRKTLSGIGKAIGPVAAAVKDFIKNALKKLGDFIADVLIKGINFLTHKVFPFLKKQFEDIQKVVKENKPQLDALGKVLKAVGGFIVKYVLPAIGILIGTLFKIYVFVVKYVIVALVDFISSLVGSGVAIVKFVKAAIGKFIDFKNAVSNAVDRIVAFIAGLPGRLSGYKDKLFKVIRDGIDGARQWVSNKVDQIVQIASNIGTRVKQAASNAFQGIRDAVSAARQWVSDKVDQIVQIVSNLKARVAGAAANAFKGVKDAISTARSWVSDKVDSIVQIAGNIKERVTRAAANAFKGVKDAISTARQWVSDKIDSIVTIVSNLGGRISRAASGAWDGLKTAFKSALNGIIRLWNNLHFSIPPLRVAGKTLFPGVSINTPDIPYLAKGGIVPATPGGQLAVLAEAGRSERVQPLDGRGLSNGEREILAAIAGLGRGETQINVYPRQEHSEVQIAREVDRQLGWSMMTA